MIGDDGSGIDKASLKIVINGVANNPTEVIVNSIGCIGIGYESNDALDGKYRWRVTGKDLAGNEIKHSERTFIIDTVRPKVRVISVK